MLQVQICPNDRYSLAEVAQMAIEGGCSWIQLHCPDASDEELRSELGDIATLCREAGAVMMLEDRPELCRELGLHGIHITHRDLLPQKMREELGPEAIIGVEVFSSSTALTLEKADIDYATVSPKLSADEQRALVDEVRSAGSKFPLVAQGSYRTDELRALLDSGYSGVCCRIDRASDPVEFTEELLEGLE